MAVYKTQEHHHFQSMSCVFDNDDGTASQTTNHNVGTAMGDANKSSTPVYCLAHTLFF